MSTPPPPAPTAADLATAADLIRAAQRICIFSGAGMSAESGIPTFRDALTGLWEQYEPTDLATPEGWRRDPDLVWGWYRARTAQVQLVAPNDGHRALADLATRKARTGGRVSIVTQNVDDLHERAGSTVDAHLHGRLSGPRCEVCPARGTAEDSLAADRPQCPDCGASMRPDVVWFGEVLPEFAWSTASRLISECDLLIIVGTSGVVAPASGLPTLAAESGTPIIEVNPERTPLTPLTAVHLRSTAAQALPAIV